MAVLDIITYPDIRLRKACRLVPDDMDFDVLHGFLMDMRDTLLATPNGFALAANQVGIDLRLVVFREPVNEEDPSSWGVINPLAIQPQGAMEYVDEACLSFPDYRKRTKRYPTVDLTFMTIDGNLQVKTLEGLWAQAAQHECHHLDGVLFVDDLTLGARERLAAKMLRERKVRR